MSKENYKKLQQLRSTERISEQEEHKIKKLQQYIYEQKINDEQKDFLMKKLDEFRSLFLKELESKKINLEEELKNAGFSEEIIKKLKKESFKRLLEFMRAYRSILKRQEFLKSSVDKIRLIQENTEMADVVNSFLDFIRSDSVAEKSMIEELVRKTPEAFLAYNLLKLREYKKSLEKGEIVQTSWVEKVKNDVINFLDQGRSIFLWGETGSGKTELAKLIGEEHSNGYEIVRGHRFMTKEEILGYLGLTATEPPSPEKVPELIKKAVKKLKENNPELSDEELKNSNKIIEKVIIGQASDPVTITKFFWGPVYRAMKEGKVLIIDEANYIDPGLIANLNAIIANYRPGIKYLIPETGEEIEVKPGFAIIMTGNLNISEAEKYTKRYRLDPALRDRVKMIEYNTLPQEYRPENSFKEAGDRDLFLIALAELIDSKGNLILPGGEASLEKIWRLCQGFKVFQEIFAGKALESHYQFNQEGRNIAVKIAENNLSLRKLINILSRWKKEGFSKTLDYYLWDEVVAQALSTPKEGAYFYQIFQKIYGFFQTPEWDQSPNYGTRGEIGFYYTHPGKIDKLISPEQRGLLPINLIDLVEAVSGEKIPEIEINISQEEKEKEMIRENIEFFEREYLYLETELKAKQNELNDYCSA